MNKSFKIQNGWLVIGQRFLNKGASRIKLSEISAYGCDYYMLAIVFVCDGESLYLGFNSIEDAEEVIKAIDKYFGV